jgi:coproporphyrinogen III oxidase
MNDFEAKVYAIRTYLLELQNTLCQALESEDGHAFFQEDLWQYEKGGGGVTRVLADGAVFEKAAVNFSHILGSQLPPAATQRHPQLAGTSFQALGVSVVLHPLNPHAPTVHLNVRFFITEQANNPIWWFGGGFDLTPYYGYLEDCQHWHLNAAKACEPFGEDIYPLFKANCDKYFYLPHRQEARGIGGILFDDLNCWEFSKCFTLMKSVGDHFLSGYLPIVRKRKNMIFTEQQRQFQGYRRGRYVEFNLLFDRGTLFGIQSGGRTESILVSLPPQVSWKYQWRPEPNTPEARLQQEFLTPKEWIPVYPQTHMF